MYFVQSLNGHLGVPPQIWHGECRTDFRLLWVSLFFSRGCGVLVFPTILPHVVGPGREAYVLWNVCFRHSRGAGIGPSQAALLAGQRCESDRIESNRNREHQCGWKDAFHQRTGKREDAVVVSDGIPPSQPLVVEWTRQEIPL